MEHESKPRRLPRYKRDPDQFGRFELTERDQAILRLVHSYRFVTSDHIIALIPGSKRQIAKRLQGMFHHGLVARLLPQLRVRGGVPETGLGSPKVTYALDSAGVQALCRADGLSPHDVNWDPSQNATMHWFMEHRLMVSTFRATLELALEQHSHLEHLGWADEEALRDSVRVRYPDGEERVHRVAPDGYFAVDDAGVRRNFFLEADRGTEEHPRILAKLLSYWWYFGDTSPYNQKYDNPRNRLVLFVCTSERRMAAIRKTLARVDDRQRGLRQFWFTTASQYDLARPAAILEPIWHVGPRTANNSTRGAEDSPRRLFDIEERRAR